MKKVNLFLYDFLMNLEYFSKFKIDFEFEKLARLHGFVRVFNFKDCDLFNSKFGFDCTYLNIDKGELDEMVCGVLVKICVGDLNKLSEIFTEFELISAEFEDFDNENSKSRGYFFRMRHFDAVDYDFNLKSQKEYLDICLNGCLNFSEKFSLNFKKTTFVGDNTLLEIGL